MSSINDINNYFNSLPEVIRIKELEHYIDTNEKIKNTFNELKELQRNMVLSKELENFNEYKKYKLLYESKNNELLDLPFVEEYLDLINYIDNILKNMTEEIEYKLNKLINE